MGDSYNDLSMLAEADVGILFCPPQNIGVAYRQFQMAGSYDDLRNAFLRVGAGATQSAQRVRARGRGGNAPTG